MTYMAAGKDTTVDHIAYGGGRRCEVVEDNLRKFGRQARTVLLLATMASCIGARSPARASAPSADCREAQGKKVRASPQRDTLPQLGLRSCYSLLKGMKVPKPPKRTSQDAPSWATSQTIVAIVSGAIAIFMILSLCRSWRAGKPSSFDLDANSGYSS
jgi:hypothetical protein